MQRMGSGSLPPFGIFILALTPSSLTLIVAPSARGLGIGRTILEQSSSALINLGMRTVELEVRESNKAARALYKKTGFVRTGRRRNYYPSESGREDAILMMCDLSENGSL